MPKKKIIDPVREFPKVERMLYAAAHAAKNKRFPIEEAITEAFWAYMECCRSYQFDKGMKFSSYVFFRVNYHLKTHITKKVKDAQKIVLMEINDDLLGESPLRRSLEDALYENNVAVLSPLERAAWERQDESIQKIAKEFDCLPEQVIFAFRRAQRKINEEGLCKAEQELLKLILNPPKCIPTIRYDWDSSKEVSTADFVKSLKEHLGFERGYDGVTVDILLHNLKAKLENRNLAFHA
jgi:uncharacterized protein YihD (DUF1040 family)